VGVLRSGVVDTEHYLGGGFPLTYFSAFHEGYTTLKGEEITFLVGVSYMRRKRIEAFVKSFMKREKKG
jgi:hypothetical protein